MLVLEPVVLDGALERARLRLQSDGFNVPTLQFGSFAPEGARAMRQHEVRSMLDIRHLCPPNAHLLAALLTLVRNEFSRHVNARFEKRYHVTSDVR